MSTQPGFAVSPVGIQVQVAACQLLIKWEEGLTNGEQRRSHHLSSEAEVVRGKWRERKESIYQGRCNKGFISQYSFSSIASLKFYGSKSHLTAKMSDIKAEQLQKQNTMNKTVIAERHLFITNTPQADKSW